MTKAWPIPVLVGAVVFFAAFASAERTAVRDLRIALTSAESRADREHRERQALADRVEALEDEWKTLGVVRTAIDLSPMVAETTAVSPSPPARPALLSINSVPASTCLLDGRVLGVTPHLKVPVAPGKHSVQFVTDRVSKTVDVTVAPGETKLAVAKLDAPAVAKGSSDDGF